MVLAIIKVLTITRISTSLLSSLYLAVRKAFERYHEETVWMFVMCVFWQSTPKSTQTHKQAVATRQTTIPCVCFATKNVVN